MVDDSLLGRRVVLRRRVGSQHYADVLGELIDAGDPVRIRRENGDVITVAEAEIHRLKAIPPRPARSVSPLELAEISAAGWPAPDTDWLGRWLLRAADGWTGRANSALPLGDPGLPVADAVDFVRDWYARRDLPARFQVPMPRYGSAPESLRAHGSAPESLRDAESLDRALAQRGFSAISLTLVQTASLAAVSGPPLDGLPEVALDPRPSAEWLSGYHYRGGDSLPAVAMSILTGARRPIFASVRIDGDVAAIARAVVDSGWLGVTALEVAPAFRRRGLAVHVMRALVTWGAGLGARQSHLEVFESNSAALALYEKLGFGTHHGYHYRIEQPATPS